MDKIEYLSFNGKEFTDFINFVKLMNSRDKSKLSRLAVFNVEDGKLIGRAIDDTSNIIEYTIEKYNVDNDEIKEPIAATVTDLIALVKSAVDNNFVIRKFHNQFEFKVIGDGWIPFKTTDANLNSFTIDGDKTNIGKINSVKLRNAIVSVLGYTQEYTYARDKYIQFNKDQMSVTSRLSSVVTSDKFVDMVIHRDDAAMLKSLLKDNFELSIDKIKSAVEQLSFTGPKFRFTIMSADIESTNINYINNIENYIKIDCDELYKLAIFSEEYSASKHILGLLVKDGKLNVSVKNVLAAKHCSAVKSEIIGNVPDTVKEAEVSSHNILKALKLFQDKRSKNINIYINDKMLNEQNSIMLFDNNTQANINIYNR
jgi:hypothetical protein